MSNLLSNDPREKTPFEYRQFHSTGFLFVRQMGRFLMTMNICVQRDEEKQQMG
jgi:hypothetical protein